MLHWYSVISMSWKLSSRSPHFIFLSPSRMLGSSLKWKALSFHRCPITRAHVERQAAQSLWSETVDCDDNRTGSLYVSRARISFERNRYMLLNGIKLSVGFPPRLFVHSRLHSVQVTSDLYLIRGTIFLIISLIMWHFVAVTIKKQYRLSVTPSVRVLVTH